MRKIFARRAIAEGREQAAVTLTIEDGRFTEVRESSEPTGADFVLNDGILVPGLIDLQVNGYHGVDFSHADGAGWQRIARRLPETGVTAFAAAFVTAPVPALAEALRRCGKAMSAPSYTTQARLLGAHLEGPFLSPAHPGAHDASSFCDPEPGHIRSLLDAAPPGTLAVITLAPERPHALTAIERLASAGVLVSIGHTAANAEETRAAVDAGARMVTHLYNAQRPFHHRDPGVIGQALVDDRVSISLVLDGHHISSQAAAMAFGMAGERLVLVTDAVAAAGIAPGRYRLGSRSIQAEKGRPPTLANGAFAGSTLRMDHALANAVHLGLPLLDAVAATTSRPADLLARPDLGRIEVGAHADLVWLNDGLATKATWVGGEPAFATPAHPSLQGGAA
ncbi:N-acetylglucosamine-6-phosphate deacetylase [Nonomuraea guangzhouensis]|uniref:N-acetylglucosamine-6-phosphate deacetylase n=1 Tax=Nonomuraea guangzhouensis TaxID=1291555 RepID=A0ABW4G6U6_9ACTN|nr:N-acetylglucosamine-6-phosphate deacetylase [Nonomuraea guangzhouensis]